MPKAVRLAVIPGICCVALIIAAGVTLWRPAAHAQAAGPTVGVWLTTTDGQNTITPQTNVNFGPDSGTNSYTIDVNEQQQFQQMLGFGAAMTDTSAYLINDKMSTAQRNAVMSALFDANSGIGVSFVRIPMGSSDFTATPANAPAPYSYDDEPAGQTDPTLANFSINHDLPYIIPALKQALQVNPNITFMANPWSPPAWMKSNDAMTGGGNLNATSFGPLAQYFVKFIQAYKAQGVPIYAITPNNEPGVSSDYSSMNFPASDETNFIKNNLGPSLANANLNTKIWAYDWNWDNTSYPETVLSDPTANSYVAGVAWHCYGGNASAMSTVHSLYPTKDQFETECSTGPTGIAGNAIDVAMHSAQNDARTVELWNLALDTNGGPKMGHGCGGCTGLVTIDQATGNYTYTPNYYQLGQFSKFVVPGAYHIASNTFGSGNLEDVAFKNPDGSKVVVVHNATASANTFKVRWNATQSFTYTVPAGGIATFKWSGTPIPLSAGYAINAGGNSTGAFTADGDYSGGQTYATTASIDTSAATNPAPQGVYQTERYGTFSYTLPNLLPGAQYNVRLHFAEIYWTSSGQRLFNVGINGAQVLTNFDIYATAGGANKAVIESYTATADSSGTITLQFTTVKDNAKISGIEVNLASFAVNAGGGAAGAFAADAFGAGGQIYSATASIDTSGVTNPAPQAVYQTERYGNFSYAIPGLTAGKTYTVRLHFAELYWTSSGKRVFNVASNGTAVLTNFDIYAAAGGANKAVVKQFTATADSSGTITVQFSTVVDNAKVSGIEILAS